MEDVIDLYLSPENDNEALICFDEKNYQLRGWKRPPIPCKPGRCRRIDYEYTRPGSKNIFIGVLPFKGERFVIVTDRRTKIDTANCLEYILDRLFSQFHVIHLVMDNLNTHSPRNMESYFGHKEWWPRLKIHYTPKHASWLNLAEIEIGVLERQTLNQRIPDEKILAEVCTDYEHRRNSEQAKINWSYTMTKARQDFGLAA